MGTGKPAAALTRHLFGSQKEQPSHDALSE